MVARRQWSPVGSPVKAGSTMLMHWKPLGTVGCQQLLTQVSKSDTEYQKVTQNNRFCPEAQGSPGIGRRTGPRASRAPQGIPLGYFRRSIDKSTVVTVEKAFHGRHVKVKPTFHPITTLSRVVAAKGRSGSGAVGAGRALQGVEYLYGGNCQRP